MSQDITNLKCHIYDSLLLKEVESLYGAIQGNKDLDLIFSIKHARKVNKDNTVRFCGRIYQILPFNGISSFCGRGG